MVKTKELKLMTGFCTQSNRERGSENVKSVPGAAGRYRVEKDWKKQLHGGSGTEGILKPLGIEKRTW